MIKTMKFHLFIIITLSLLLGCNQEPRGIIVEDGYVRGLPASVDNTSAYMRIVNNTDETLVLTGGRSSIAKSVTLHRTENVNGMMNMEHTLSLSIESHQTLVLESGGVHLMLTGLVDSILPGANIEIVLEFEEGLEYIVNLPVRSVLDE